MPDKRKGETGKQGNRGKGKAGRGLSPFSDSLVSKQRGRTVSIIGAGRLGSALALALGARGFRVEAIASRRLGSARRACGLVGAQTRALSLAQLDRLSPTSIIFITTPDDAIEQTAQQLATKIKWSGSGCVALHASGALSSEALSSLRAIKFSTGSMHPLISVSDPRTGAQGLGKAHYCIEGQPQAVRLARSLVRELGGQSFSIRTRDKALYHAAAVMSSGHMVALFDLATELLARCGLSEKQSRAALLPLMQSTLENLSTHAPPRALTGTFARADLSTVNKHLDALRELKTPDALAAYILLGQRSLELAKKNGADISMLKKIARALKEALKQKQ
ncbi:MAG: DUF2520 domain-containing protein [Pyrinomonadaceae bacterium]|nr:DUF2520 domain-containing protein [Pyrinomonadaceae bacterium]